MMSKQVLLLFLLISLGACHPFSATITTADVFKVGDEILCKVTITNSLNSDLYILRRNTPLEVISSNIFVVTSDGAEVRYDGLLYQRTEPSLEEYAKVPAKSSLLSVVDLSRSYAFASEGKYSVKLDSTFTYYKTSISNTSLQRVTSNVKEFAVKGKQEAPRLTEAGELRNSTSSIKKVDLPTLSLAYAGALIKPAFTGTASSEDMSIFLQSVYPAVYAVLSTSYLSVTGNPKLYNTWFGLQYQGYMDTVRGAYLSIKSALETYQFTIYFDGPQCAGIPNVVAYTYHGSTVLYMCSIYRTEANTKGSSTKLGTIVHELTHAVAYTDDITYGQQNCLTLAKDHPNEAIKNADNYRLFSEPLVR